MVTWRTRVGAQFELSLREEAIMGERDRRAGHGATGASICIL